VTGLPSKARQKQQLVELPQQSTHLVINIHCLQQGNTAARQLCCCQPLDRCSGDAHNPHNTLGLYVHLCKTLPKPGCVSYPSKQARPINIKPTTHVYAALCSQYTA
jgi:hypothetical protein